ncbi:MAG: cysteine--tRNA ligase [Gemmatimonadetes bacterium]|nr:MAG: cysteine--tRNA ligase [Gemmatimonadota bacterium]
MALSLYNTLTRRVEPFTPLLPPRVTIYTCGPTVWQYAHLGNFRTFLFEDLLRRHLEFLGYDVFHIMNLTDVDDRTIKAAAAAGKRLEEHTAPFVQAFFDDRDYLRIQPAHVYPRATEAIPAMVRLVGQLLDKGVAYKGEDGSVYFAIGKFPTYGRLSRLDRRELKVGARVASDEYAKDDPRDFALWKRAEPIDEQVGAAWDAPFGRGRPGWHLECSAMSLDAISRFGVATLDIHAGGIDLIFPHHEDEIAQSEAATGQPFARFWLHGEFLNVRGTKMSKRFGNFLTARDLREQRVDAAAVRLLFWQTHYRQALDFNDEALEGAKEGVKRLGELRARLVERAAVDSARPGVLAELASELLSEFGIALDDDLGAPRAVAALFEFVRAANRELDRGQGGIGTGAAAGAGAALAVFDRVMTVLDVLPTAKALTPEFAAWVEGQLAAREKARRAKDFREADRIRAALRAKGVELEDTPAGTKWRAG